jgi:phage terminase large subunit-like protein
VKDRVELLVLLPKGNYKTTLFAALAVFHTLTVQNANCFIGAADKLQADEMYRFASHFAETHAAAKQRS